VKAFAKAKGGAVEAVESPRFYSVGEVARLLGMAEMTVYRAIHAGEFPAIKFRGRYVVPAKALDDIVQVAMTTGALVDVAAWTAAAESGVAR